MKILQLTLSNDRNKEVNRHFNNRTNKTETYYKY